MNAKQKSKWMVDAALYLVFIAAFFLDLTGLSLHQWLGVIAFAVAGYHFLTHWSWVRAVSARIFGTTSSIRPSNRQSSAVNRSQLYYLIDAVILSGFVLMTSTGLAISSWLDLALANYETWRLVHILASVGTLLVTVLKLGLHWRWIASVARDIFSSQVGSQPKVAPVRLPVPAQPAPVAKRMSRREFLQVMGMSGLAALAASTSAVTSLQGAETTVSEGTSSQSAASQSNSASQDWSTSSLGSVSTTCSVRCRRGCSYPGHCRRYVDANSNHLCDLGECA